MHRFSLLPAVALWALVLPGCEPGDAPRSPEPAAASELATPGLSDEQLRDGIGPIRSLELTAINSALAEEGRVSYEQKCTSCHAWEERLLGPPMHDVVKRRTPAFIMNMMLNPAGMEQRHPEVQRMREEYGVPMPNQFLSGDEARAILEYLRQRTP